MAPTREEIAEAVRRFQEELDVTAPQIRDILDEFDREREQAAAAERQVARTQRSSPTGPAFFAEEKRYTGERPYVLPFGREYGKWNPRDVENHPFGQSWLGGTLALICQRTDENRSFPTRLIHTSGGPVPSPDDRIGLSFTARHDQTGAKLGVYEIVGIVVYAPDGSVARLVGDVPDRKYSLNTYK